MIEYLILFALVIWALSPLFLIAIIGHYRFQCYLYKKISDLDREDADFWHEMYKRETKND